MTACRRPGILRQTLDSFARHLAGLDLRNAGLYLNVDPVPAGTDDAQQVAAVAAEYFGFVVLNNPAEPNFAAAVKWCWRQPGGEYFLHLEDDWELLRRVDIAVMLARLRDDAALSLVNLRSYPHNDDRLCLAPGLWRSAHARAIALRMRADANPERQLRPARANNPHGGLHAGYKGVQYPERDIVLKDLGRAWMSATAYQREGGRDFNRWVTKQQQPSVIAR